MHSKTFLFAFRFNPIAATLLKTGLNRLLGLQFDRLDTARPSKDVVDIIVQSSNGDIRSAIMALQFACVIDLPTGQGKKSKKNIATV